MLPMPDTTVWSNSARLISVRRRRMPATAASRSNAGSIGSRAMWAIGAGRKPPSAAGTADHGDRTAVQAGGEIGVPGDVAAHGARVLDRDLDDRALHHLLGGGPP